MDKMTDSRAAEAQAQGGGEVWGWATPEAVQWSYNRNRPYSEVTTKITREPQPEHGFTVPLYLAPPSAPVGVGVASLPALWRSREDNGEERTEFDKGYEQASDECAESLERALAQQPAAVDDEENRDAWRALWLVLRQTGTVTVTRHEIVSADWSRCQVEQTEHEMTGTVRLRATLLDAQPGGSDND